MLKDRELQSKYDLWIRNHVYKMGKIMTALQCLTSMYTVLTNIEKEFYEQAPVLMQLGSLSASLLLGLLFIKLKLKLVDYGVFFIMVVLCMFTLLAFYLIDTAAPGFTLVDKKDYISAITFVAIPLQLLAICNLKFNYLITTPLTILSILLVEKRAYTTDGDNMSCFKNPEKFAARMSARSILLIFLFIAVGYMYRKSTLERFIEQEKSKKQ